MIGHARVVQGAETTDVPPGRRIQDHERKAPFGFVVATECRDIEAAVALLAEDGVFLRGCFVEGPREPGLVNASVNLGAMNVEVRSTTAADWSLLRDLSLRALADSPDAFRTTLEEAQAFTEGVWRQRAEGSAPTLMVLEDGRGVAMGGVFKPPDSAVAYVWGMWTGPEVRGRGYAAGLLADLVNWCRDRDFGVRLRVTEGNEAARRLYVAHGFQPTGVREPLREGSELRVEEMQLVE